MCGNRHVDNITVFLNSRKGGDFMGTLVTVASDASGMTTTNMNSAIEGIMGVVSAVVSTISDNPILMIFFCAGLVGVAIGIVRKLKK